MSKGLNLITILLGLVFLLSVIVGVVVTIQHVVRNEMVSTGLVDLNTLAIVGSIIISGLILKSGLRMSKESIPRLQEEKISAYKRFVDNFYKGLPADESWHELTSSMTLYASAPVLRRYLKLEKLMDASHDDKLILNTGEKIIFEMRKDLGHSNLGILVSDFINTEKRFRKYESKKKVPQTKTI